MAIQSFSDKTTEIFFVSGNVRKGTGWMPVSRIARRKLDILQYASELKDLKAMPGNRLKSLKGDLKGCHSIRINDQWRIIFKWSDHGAKDVLIADYHQ